MGLGEYLGLEAVEINLSKEDIKKKKDEEFIISDLQEVIGRYGRRWKLRLQDTEGCLWAVFVNEKQIKKLITAYGRNINNIRGKKIKFDVVPVVIAGQEHETIEIKV
jgi:predicted SpoU family rRNA methylase